MKNIIKNNWKALVIFLGAVFLVVISLTGCAPSEPELVPANVNATNQTNTTRQVLGKEALIELGSGLYYDSVTGIVYWWNGRFDLTCYGATTPTPYYATNGYPYRYNPETNTLEEIGGCRTCEGS